MRSLREATVHNESHNYLELIQVAPVSSVREIPQYQQKLSTLQKWGYSLLAFAFVVGGLQAVRCGIMSTLKLEGLLKQKAVVESVNHQVQARNNTLKDKISLYASPLGVEEMARDRLNMVGKDEILVRIYPTAVAKAQ